MPSKFNQALADVDERVREKVVAIYEKADEMLQARMESELKTKLTKARVNATISYMENVTRQAIVQTKPAIDEGVQSSYVLGALQVDVSLDKEDTITFEKLSPAQREQVAALSEEAYLNFAKTLTVVSNSARQTLNEALRRQIRERVTTGILLGDSVESIAKDLREEIFTPSGITAFVKKNGARLSLRDYSRTVTRSMIIKSANEGTAARMGALKLTVFQISTHAGGAEDAACADHQGVLYDWTGKQYPKPQAEDIPPYHPNCRHIIQPRPDLQFSK